MPTVAEQLRAAREAKKLTVQQVADATKIRTDHIRALENGNFNVFSAPIYIRGSVKNYATMLKLDVPQIMAALDAELKGTEKFSEPPPLVEASKIAARPRDVPAGEAERESRRWPGAAFVGIVLVVAARRPGRGGITRAVDPARQPAARRLSTRQFRRHAAAAEKVTERGQLARKFMHDNFPARGRARPRSDLHTSLK